MNTKTMANKLSGPSSTGLNLLFSASQPQHPCCVACRPPRRGVQSFERQSCEHPIADDSHSSNIYYSVVFFKDNGQNRTYILPYVLFFKPIFLLNHIQATSTPIHPPIVLPNTSSNSAMPSPVIYWVVSIATDITIGTINTHLS